MTGIGLVDCGEFYVIFIMQIQCLGAITPLGFSLRSTGDYRSKLASSARSLRDCRPLAVTFQAAPDALPHLAVLQPALRPPAGVRAFRARENQGDAVANNAAVRSALMGGSAQGLQDGTSPGLFGQGPLRCNLAVAP